MHYLDFTYSSSASMGNVRSTALAHLVVVFPLRSRAVRTMVLGIVAKRKARGRGSAACRLKCPTGSEHAPPAPASPAPPICFFIYDCLTGSLAPSLSCRSFPSEATLPTNQTIPAQKTMVLFFDLRR